MVWWRTRSSLSHVSQSRDCYQKETVPQISMIFQFTILSRNLESLFLTISDSLNYKIRVPWKLFYFFFINNSVDSSSTKIGEMKRNCVKKMFKERIDDQNYVRFVNSRHPMSRILSAWRQKFDKNFSGAHTFMKYAKKINKLSEKNRKSDTHLGTAIFHLH